MPTDTNAEHASATTTTAPETTGRRLHDIAIKLDLEGTDYGIVQGYADGCIDSPEFAALIQQLKPLLTRAEQLLAPHRDGECGAACEEEGDDADGLEEE